MERRIDHGDAVLFLLCGILSLVAFGGVLYASQQGFGTRGEEIVYIAWNLFYPASMAGYALGPALRLLLRCRIKAVFSGDYIFAVGMMSLLFTIVGLMLVSRLDGSGIARLVATSPSVGVAAVVIYALNLKADDKAQAAH